MLTPDSLIGKFAHLIVALPDKPRLDRIELLTADFRLQNDGSMDIYYCPFEHVNPDAKLAIVGLTPGWQQMELAFRTASKALREGRSNDEACEAAECAGAFAGSMRANLVKMLDDLGMAKHLGVSSTRSLFEETGRAQIHTTSAVRYPVFVNGKNYSGGNPSLETTPALLSYVRNNLAAELQLGPRALIIPQGKMVTAALEMLIQAGTIHRSRCLLGFPHASGAIGTRKATFESKREQFSEVVRRWFAT